MSGGAPFQPVAQALERGLSIRNVYAGKRSFRSFRDPAAGARFA